MFRQTTHAINNKKKIFKNNNKYIVNIKTKIILIITFYSAKNRAHYIVVKLPQLSEFIFKTIFFKHKKTNGCHTVR